MYPALEQMEATETKCQFIDVFICFAVSPCNKSGDKTILLRCGDEPTRRPIPLFRSPIHPMRFCVAPIPHPSDVKSIELLQA